MAFMKMFMDLFDEDSNLSIDKVLDKVEKTIGATVDEVETSMERLASLPEKAAKMSEGASTTIDKLKETAGKQST